MDKAGIVARIAEIGKAIENSLAQHNALVGRLNEAQYILQQMEQFEEDCKKKDIGGVIGDAASIAEEVIQAV